MRIANIEYELGSNRELWSKLQEDNLDWDVNALAIKTGINVRHISTSSQTALTLALDAGNKMLENVDRGLIEGILYVTQSPDSAIPSTACLLHEKLKLPKNNFAFDINQGCSGFVYGISLASSLMVSANMKNVLVICAETYSRYISKNDRACRPIFSDAASATLVVNDGLGMFGPFVFMTDGSGAPNLTLKHSPNPNSLLQLHMDGPRVMMFTMSAVPKATMRLLELANLQLDQVDLYIYHQASALVLDNIQRLLKIPEKKFFRCLSEFGNTVSSTIPIALKCARDAGVLKEGMTIMLMGFGVGYSLAGCIVKT
jgi:3-oxoacyl-[acyl-carrier-protein] synthase-3